MIHDSEEYLKIPPKKPVWNRTYLESIFSQAIYTSALYFIWLILFLHLIPTLEKTKGHVDMYKCSLPALKSGQSMLLTGQQNTTN